MKSTFITLAAFLLMFIACDNRTPYEKMLQRELDSGIRQDTLFLGYYLGMPKQEFFDHSWELNQRKIVRGDSFVRYRLEGDRKSTRLNSSHVAISYAVFCLKKKKYMQLLSF